MIGELIENIPMMLIPGYIGFLILLLVKNIYKDNHGSFYYLKFILCLKLTTIIMVGIMVILMMNVYQLATIWEEYELAYTLNPLIESVSYGLLEFIWSMIGILISWSLFKMICFRQILPGEGNVKERFVNLVKG